MKVVLSTFAIADIAAIRGFIARDDPDRARSFVAALRDTISRIADLPCGFPLVPRYERHGIRRRSWRGYGVLYSVLPDRIFVHRVLGPGQDIDRILGLA